MKELIGKQCIVEFDLPIDQWPIPGFPAWVVVGAVEMPMIKMRSDPSGKEIWVNVDIIKSIQLWLACPHG